MSPRALAASRLKKAAKEAEMKSSYDTATKAKSVFCCPHVALSLQDETSPIVVMQQRQSQHLCPCVPLTNYGACYLDGLQHWQAKIQIHTSYSFAQALAVALQRSKLVRFGKGKLLFLYQTNFACVHPSHTQVVAQFQIPPHVLLPSCYFASQCCCLVKLVSPPYAHPPHLALHMQTRQQTVL